MRADGPICIPVWSVVVVIVFLAHVRAFFDPVFVSVFAARAVRYCGPPASTGGFDRPGWVVAAAVAVVVGGGCTTLKREP